MGAHGLLAATAGFCLFGISVTLGHTGDRVVPFYEITEELLGTIDLTDGSVEDWIEVGPPTLTLLDFFVWENPNYSNTSQRNPSDLDIQIWLGWMKSPPRIYLASIRADNDYVNEYPDIIGEMPIHDSIALGVDGDHSGGPLFRSGGGSETEETRLIHNKHAQLYHALPEVPEGRNVQLLFSTLWEWERWLEEPPFSGGGGAVAGENPFVSITEFYVTPFDLFVYTSPEESVESELYAGKTIGFRLVAIDIDTAPGLYQGIYDLQSDPSSGAYMEFSDGILLGADDLSGQDADDGAVVKPDSWARIKASFRE